MKNVSIIGCFHNKSSIRKLPILLALNVNNRCLYSTVSGLRSGLHRLHHHLKWDSNPKGTNIFSWKGTASDVGNKGTSIINFEFSHCASQYLINPWCYNLYHFIYISILCHHSLSSYNMQDSSVDYVGIHFFM